MKMGYRGTCSIYTSIQSQTSNATSFVIANCLVGHNFGNHVNIHSIIDWYVCQLTFFFFPSGSIQFMYVDLNKHRFHPNFAEQIFQDFE